MTRRLKTVSKDLSIIVPVLEETDGLEPLLSGLVSGVGELGISFEILVADVRDGDRTREVAERFGAVYVRAEGGFGAAIMGGVAESVGEYVLTIDLDAAHPGEVVRTLWEARREADVVVTSRYVAGAKVEQPWLRHLMSRGINAFFSKVLSTPIRDLSNGNRIYRHKVFERVAFQTQSLAFLMETHLKCLGNGVRVKEVPVHYQLREYRDAQAHGLKLAIECLGGIFQLWRMRNSVECADYDLRAYDSRIFFQRYWQRTRHRLVTGFVPKGGLALDAGCGSGRIIADLPNAAGVDIRFEKVYFMRTLNPWMAQSDACHLPFPDGAFDSVVCSEVIEHIPEEEGRLIDELTRVLKPGGTLVLGTPDYGTFWWPFFESLYRKVAPNAYAHEHVTHYTFDTLKQALEARGYDVVDHGYVCRSVLVFKALKRG